MRSIEKLVIWLIPTQILGVACQVTFSLLSAERVLNQPYSPTTAWFSVASALSYLIGQIVIAIWLFNQEHRKPSLRWVWSMFGLFAGFWGLGIYLLIQIPAVSALFTNASRPHQGPDA